MTDLKDIRGLDDRKLEAALAIRRAYEEGRLSLEEAHRRLKSEVRSLKPWEIARIEQDLTAEQGGDDCRSRRISELFLIYGPVLDRSRPELPADHPIARYYQENDRERGIVQEIEDLLQYPVIRNQWLELYDRLSEIRRHFSRKQNQLYSVLEKKGFDHPSTRMWLFDDAVRDEIRENRRLLEAGQDDEFIARQASLLEDLKDLMAKEEQVLLPTSLMLVNRREFEEMRRGDAEIGYAWLGEGADPERGAQAAPAASDVREGFSADLQKLLVRYGLGSGASADGKLEMRNGRLTLEQVNLVLRNLPLDISFVDENDLVAYYSDTEHRIFPRSRNVIGRQVRNCHPRTSVKYVEEILAKFKSGEEDTADFWIDGKDAFVYIRYVAVRDEKGKFRGVLETMQDCTRIRELTGSRTLLTWSSETHAPERLYGISEPGTSEGTPVTKDGCFTGKAS
ncbi:DUF438 domain-containing protein [Mesosutterella sp. AGMB02718]|uniref:DUF438 domain-containing protein n=1 Tax=Mesosutterella faecium TaxID=2925194 RepID=A0ABT7ILX3_9BURK|nr:DUF438 domain-containing protein [Mesosutterella sp. AGMB02718]MDL2059368.1 DUF438 domain-containing protein [Mesosutterella sp. AGMB02718]